MKTSNSRPNAWPFTIAVTFLAMFLLCINLLGNCQSGVPYGLDEGADSTKKTLWLGTPSQPAKDIYGVQIRFLGDFTGTSPDSIGLNMNEGWFLPGDSGTARQWTIDGDSASAVLALWDLDSALHTGSGTFLRLTLGGGVGNLAIDDIFKTVGSPGLKLLKRDSSQLLVYPNPAPAGTSRTVRGAEIGQVIEVYDAKGRLLQQLKGTGSPLELQPMDTGTFFLCKRSWQTGLVTARKMITVQ